MISFNLFYFGPVLFAECLSKILYPFFGTCFMFFFCLFTQRLASETVDFASLVNGLLIFSLYRKFERARSITIQLQLLTCKSQNKHADKKNTKKQNKLHFFCEYQITSISSILSTRYQLRISPS